MPPLPDRVGPDDDDAHAQGHSAIGPPCFCFFFFFFFVVVFFFFVFFFVFLPVEKETEWPAEQVR